MWKRSPIYRSTIKIDKIDSIFGNNFLLFFLQKKMQFTLNRNTRQLYTNVFDTMCSKRVEFFSLVFVRFVIIAMSYFDYFDFFSKVSFLKKWICLFCELITPIKMVFQFSLYSFVFIYLAMCHRYGLNSTSNQHGHDITSNRE